MTNTNEIMNEMMNEAADAIEENVANDVVDAVVANDCKGIGLVEGTLIVAGGVLAVYAGYKAVKWGVGKFKAVKAAKKAAKREEIVAEVEAEEAEEAYDTVEA